MQEVEKTTVKRQQSMKRQHRRTRHKGGYIILVICLVAGIAFSLTVTRLFNVSRVTIHNTTNVSDEDLIAICGFENGDNMMRMNFRAMEKRLEEQIVYAKDVSVRRELPSTIVISVDKAEPVINIGFDEGYLLISDTGRILEYLSDAPREGLLVVNGYPAKDPAVGDKLHAEDTRHDNVLHQLIKAVMEADNPAIGVVDMADISDIKVFFGENITFQMGSINEAAYKLKFAAKAAEQISTRKKYRLRMVGNNQISVLSEDDLIRQPEKPAETLPVEDPANNTPQENQPADNGAENPAQNGQQENQPADNGAENPAQNGQQENQPADNGAENPAQNGQQENQPADNGVENPAQNGQQENQPADNGVVNPPANNPFEDLPQENGQQAGGVNDLPANNQN